MINEKDPLEEKSAKEYDEKIIDAFKDKKPKDEGPLISELEKQKIIEKQKDLKTLPDEFDPKNIADLAYLTEIFSSKYDKFGSLSFLQKTRDNMVKDGYPDCATLNEFLFWTTMSRRLQINYQRIHAKLINKEGIEAEEAENLDILKEMRDISTQVSTIQKSLDAMLEKRRQIRDVTDLHAETMKEAEEFIKSHIGEFSFRCFKCGTIVQNNGLPHFAIMTEKDDTNGETIYHTFSKEIWYLYQKKLIPLQYAAFILRTSPEGFLITAKKRGEYGSGPALEDMNVVEKEENELKKLRKEFDDREESNIK